MNLIEKEIDLIKQIAKVLNEENPNIIDLQYYDKEEQVDNVILIFGDKAAKQCKDLKPLWKMELPNPLQLAEGFGEEKTRQETYSRLLAFKQSILAKPGDKTRDIIGKKEGQVVRLSEKPGADVNINITPIELSLIQTLKSVLQVEELHLVKSNPNRKDDITRNSTNNNI